jgi:23S rRNA (guanosine2251-2'-O)-methyltransferase
MAGGGGIARGGQGGRAAKAGSHRKGAAAGSGGLGRKALRGRGATPPAHMRPGHPAQQRAAARAARDADGRDGQDARGARDSRDARGGRDSRDARGGSERGAAGRGSRAERDERDTLELVVGRNAVVEALRAGVPATTLYIAAGVEYDQRLDDARKLASAAAVPVVDTPRADLDRLTGRHAVVSHQGLALVVPPFDYAHPDEVIQTAIERPPGLLVALDGITDPRNLGAVARSAAAFGAHGVIIPERRAAGITAAAWKTSAGAAARLPVARATNLARTLVAAGSAGLLVVGLAADAELSIYDLPHADDGLVLVAGSEGRGLSRLVGERCDLTVKVPMAGPVESLNASVAASVALAEIARRRAVGA